MKNALITGANRGLGFEVSRQLAQLGYQVFVSSRSVEKAEAAVREIGLNAQAVSLDVSEPSSVRQASQMLREKLGHLDVLVNNAAVHYDTNEHASNADLDGVVSEAFETNVLGPWRVIQGVLPLLRASKNPIIVNVSSEAGSLANMGDGPPAYQVTKAALNALTKTLAGELGGKFKVNAVCPGWVETEMGGIGGRPVQEGAEGIVWAATLPPEGPTGGFFRDRLPLPW